MEKISEGTFTVVLLALIQGVLASGAVEVQPSINPAVVGDTVTLSLSPSPNMTSGSWAVGESVILNWVGDRQAVFDSHTGRASVNVITGALTLNAVKVADSGVYVVESTAPPLWANASITVLEPVSNVMISVNETNLMEMNGSAVLKCSVSSGSSLSFLWMNGSSEVTASDRVQLTDGNSTLTIVNVTRYDHGPFRCHVFNLVSNGTSDPLNFMILYGPDNMALTVNGQNTTSFPDGSNLTMLCSAQSNPPAQLQWAVRGELVNTTGPLYELFNVSKDQSGPYTCLALNNHTNMNSNITTLITIGKLSSGSEQQAVNVWFLPLLLLFGFLLSFQVPISNVTLMANATNLVEFNDTAVLMCSVSIGSSLTYVWLKGDSVVTAGGGVQLSDGGATLTIVRVTRYDEGPFRCNVSNGISNEISLPVHLNISYGPSNTTMMIMPMKSYYRTGSNITLSCSAVSSPPASIQWLVNGVYLNQFSSQLQLEGVTESNSGVYKCLFHNRVTSRFSSTSAMIRIMEPLEAAVVNHTGGPAILNEPFTLHCNIIGSVDKIQWWRNGQLISADNITVFGMSNKTLTLDPVRVSDNGDYQCQAFNYVSNITSSPYTVEVNYGPEMPTIMGPNVVPTGVNIKLICHASSNPLSAYKWFFNDSAVANTSEYVTPPLTRYMSGMYTCMAFNNITGKNSTAYRMLTVVDPLVSVEVEAPMNPAIEGHSYKLICNVTGYADHVYWMKNLEPLHEDNRTVFSMDNKTVTFSPLTCSDRGAYQCKASNAILNMTSSSYPLLVNFGPETPIINVPDFVEEGYSVNFTCLAKSMPPSRFSWWFNGSEVANTSLFIIGSISLNMSGEYTCVAYNDVTGKNSSNSKILTVIGSIKSVVIRHNGVPVNNENFTLTCEVTGPYDTIYWMMNDTMLTMNNSTAEANVSYHVGNNMLYFTPVTIYNDGPYYCVATNRARQQKSHQYMLLVNYGPLRVHISGPDSAKFGYSVSWKCSADSRPDCDFYWFFNNQSSALNNGSVLTFPALKQFEGNYKCKARNPVTNITMYKTKAFTIDHASALHTPSQGGLMLMVLFVSSVAALFN
ncbi:carcinoembryonic antigen-related cell adhesion molecule 1 [Symphorus nematophorus]